MQIDLTDRIHMDTKTITVLNDETDVRTVLARYHRKGWHLRGIARDETQNPIVVHLILARPAND